MPEIRVWPDSSSVFTWKVGSSSDSFARAMLIFSWSALVFGSTATSITGSGKVMDSREIGDFSSHRVSPVVTFFRPTKV
mgnify:CR=1 FL=1